MTAPDSPIKRPATILRTPEWHQRIARVRITLWRIMATARPDPGREREHPGGMFAPRKDTAA